MTMIGDYYVYKTAKNTSAFPDKLIDEPLLKTEIDNLVSEIEEFLECRKKLERND